MTNHGLPRFSDCEFHTAYPFGQVTLADAEVPLDVRLEAFNPLIPGHADNSGIPVAVLRFVLTNPGSAPVEAAVCGGLENFNGNDDCTACRSAPLMNSARTGRFAGCSCSRPGWRRPPNSGARWR